MNIKEEERRNKIRGSLKEYFKSDKGLLHRKKISSIQTKRMALYGIFINNISNKIEDEENN